MKTADFRYLAGLLIAATLLAVLALTKAINSTDTYGLAGVLIGHAVATGGATVTGAGVRP